MKTLLIFFLVASLPLWGNDNLQQIHEELTSYIKELGSPQASAALFYNGKTYFWNWGRATENTSFKIASITKVFTTTELALEVLRGQIKLDDHLSKFYPHLQKSTAEITLKQLATHTSGLPRSFPGSKQWTPEHPPGTQYLYSNIGFGILGNALGNNRHIPYQQLITRDILDPLKMTSTGFNISPAPGSGAIHSTSKDMLQFLLANLQLAGPKELQNAMQFAQEPQFKVRDKLTMGLGWQRVSFDALLIIDKNGGLPDYSSYIGFLPEQKIGIVLLVNQTRAKPAQLGRKILKALSKG